MKSTIDDTQIRRVASLARISLSEDEKQAMRSELGKILTYFERLQEVDLEGVTPLSHVHGSTNVFREDNPLSNSHQREEILANAPEKSGAYLKVPLTIASPSQE